MRKSTFIIITLLLFNNAWADSFWVRFGKGTDCSGFNFCEISKNASKNYGETQVEIIMTKSKHLQFSIQRKDINNNIYFKFFSTGFFFMDGDFELPEGLCRQLEIDNYTIRSGKYEIKEDNEQFIIIL